MAYYQSGIQTLQEVEEVETSYKYELYCSYRGSGGIGGHVGRQYGSCEDMLFADDKDEQLTSLQNRETKKSENYSFEMITWVGYVLQIDDDTFSARLRNLYVNENDMEADISKKDVMDDDIPLLKKGACFYYSIGYVYDNGQRKKVSILKFKRKVNFTANDVDEIGTNVDKWKNNINWE